MILCGKSWVGFSNTTRPGSIEVLSLEGRSEVPVDKDPVGQLHDVFGISEAQLADWFRR